MSISIRLKNAVAGRLPSTGSNQGSQADTQAMVAAAEASIEKVSKRALPKGDTEKQQQKILDSIEPIYYSTSTGFDPVQYELEKLPDGCDLKHIEKDYKRKKDQLSVVFQRISALIVAKHPSYAAELAKVAELQEALKRAYELTSSRCSSLQSHQRATSTSYLRVLHCRRRAQRCEQVRQALSALKALRDADYHVRDLLETSAYAAAVQLGIDFMGAATSFAEYDAVHELSRHLAETLDMQRECVRQALTTSLLHYDEDQYRQLVHAYRVLHGGECDTAGIVIECARCAIDATAMRIVRAHLSSTTIDEFDDLCLALSHSTDSTSTVVCVDDVARSLWRILRALHAIATFHKNAIEAEMESCDVAEKLEAAFNTVWSQCSTKLNALVLAIDTSLLAFDDVLRVLGTLSALCTVGDTYFRTEDDPPTALTSKICEITSDYFLHYHAARLDELRTFLEAETWLPCPVPRDFGISTMPEFAFLFYGTASTTRDETSLDAFADGVFEAASTLTASPKVVPVLATTLLLFAQKCLLKSERQETDSDDETSDDFAITCNSGVHVLRLISRYVRVMCLMRDNLTGIFTNITQVLDYFTNAICHLFASDTNARLAPLFIDSQLDAVLTRARSLLSTLDHPAGTSCVPQVSPAVDIDEAKTLYALPARRVAVQTLYFVVAQMIALCDMLVEIVDDPAHRVRIKTWQSTLSSLSSDALQMHIYGAAASRCIDYEALVDAVAKTDWSIENICTQHSSYVDRVGEELKTIAARDVLHRIGDTAFECLWQCVFLSINRSIIDGYASSTRKCTAAGRARMQLDYEQLCRTFAHVSSVAVTAEMRSPVDGYIRAYYMSEAQLTQWLRDHARVYTEAHLRALVDSAIHLPKKSRQQILALVQQNAP